MWKSREAFEKSTFFKRLALQGFESLETFWDFLESGRLKSKRSFRLNPLRDASLEDFQKESFKIGERYASWENLYHFDLEQNTQLSDHPFWGAGLAYVQDPVALEIVASLEIQKNDGVWDMCAAPGGKSLRIAELLSGTGWLCSNDKDLKRARQLSHLLLRYGAFRSSIFAKDASELAAHYRETFDRVLLDAPCSGESLFFKREERRRDVYESEVQECVGWQWKLLKAAALALKPGGKLVYSTCTYNLSENEEVVRRFLKEHPECTLLEEQRRWPHRDNTAGGYWAVIEKSGNSPRGMLPLGHSAWSERHGLLDREGQPSLYAQAMNLSAGKKMEEEERLGWRLDNLEDWLLMTNAEAKEYLAGQSMPNPAQKRGYYRMLYKGKWPLGPAKAVESRFNNLLPLEARIKS